MKCIWVKFIREEVKCSEVYLGEVYMGRSEV